jgi:hypothetical protein
MAKDAYTPFDEFAQLMHAAEASGTKPLLFMGLRDYFAGQALAGLLAGQVFTTYTSESVEQAYALADEMLKERLRGQPKT